MKYIFLLFFIFSIVSCSKTPEQKACIAVEKYLKQNLDDPKSYEPGAFSIDSVSDTVFKGWKVTHEFRAKNAFGAVIKEEGVFFVDKDFKVEPY